MAVPMQYKKIKYCTGSRGLPGSGRSPGVPLQQVEACAHLPACGGGPRALWAAAPLSGWPRLLHVRSGQQCGPTAPNPLASCPVLSGVVQSSLALQFLDLVFRLGLTPATFPLARPPKNTQNLMEYEDKEFSNVSKDDLKLEKDEVGARPQGEGRGGASHGSVVVGHGSAMISIG